MTREEKLEKIADILDIDVDDLKEEAILADYEEWDSVAVLSFIALMDEEFDRAVKGSEIRSLTTVQDLMNFME